METLIPLFKSIALALVVLLVGFIVIKVITNFIKKHITRSKLDDSLKPFTISLIDALLKILLIISVISILGINVSSFAAILAASGFAVGLAFQGSLSNFAGGILLLTLRPFKVGDYIDGAGFSGTVKGIQILYTELTTLDNKAIFIPNGELSNAGIVNYSANDTRRLDLVFGVGYQSNNQHVIKTLKTVVDQHPLIFKTPEPFVRLTKHGDSALEYTLRVWVKSDDYWIVHYDLLEQVKDSFDHEGIEIPYPQMDIHLSK